MTSSFDYIVKRQQRKTISLHVMPDATVEVRVPKWVPKREWIKFVEARTEWVIQQQRAAQEKLLLTPGFFHGQCHPYLGEKYPLSVTYAARPATVWRDNTVHIQVCDPENSDLVEKALARWYRVQARSVFEERIGYCYSLFPLSFQHQYGVPAITLRQMRRRWGSCSLQGEVTLNVQLIKMPLSCIDYVIAHELCHLAVFNHSAAFYQLLVEVMPDWKARKRLLEAQE